MQYKEINLWHANVDQIEKKIEKNTAFKQFYNKYVAKQNK